MQTQNRAQSRKHTHVSKHYNHQEFRMLNQHKEHATAFLTLVSLQTTVAFGRQTVVNSGIDSGSLQQKHRAKHGATAALNCCWPTYHVTTRDGICPGKRCVDIQYLLAISFSSADLSSSVSPSFQSSVRCTRISWASFCKQRQKKRKETCISQQHCTYDERKKRATYSFIFVGSSTCT